MNLLSRIFDLYLRYPAWTLLFFGFGAGLPFKVIFGVNALYLRQLGFELSVITLFSLMGLFFSLKFLWSPLLERPRLGGWGRRWGRRRGSLLGLQILLVALFLWIGLIDPNQSWWFFVLILGVISFCGATQDIVIDALRIELMPPERQGILTANYLIGYRIGLIAGISVPLYVVEYTGDWYWGFAAIALMILPVMVVTVVVREPPVPDKKTTGAKSYAWELWQLVREAVGEFYARYRAHLWKVILVVILYRLCDLLLGVVAYPFYNDLGYSNIQIANYSGIMGVIVTLIGGLIGGYLLNYFSWRILLIFGLWLAALSNLAFIFLGFYGDPQRDLPLILAIVADNLAGGIATTIFVAWISAMVNLHFTVMQYAVLSSISTLPGKFIGGSGGWLIESIQVYIERAPLWSEWVTSLGTNSLIGAYALFFGLTTLIALPIWVVIWRLPDYIVKPYPRKQSSD